MAHSPNGAPDVRGLYEDPPTGLRNVLGRVGPGLILAGNIVGSGELIATPALSAQAGFTFLWLIVLSCFIKVFFQIEIGRYAISEGRTTLDSFNDLPGPRLGVNWLLWYWLAMMIAGLVQIGGMCGGVAQALRIALPIWSDPSQPGAQAINDNTWAVLTGLSVIVLLSVGRYRMIEWVALVLVSVFTLVTLYSVVQLQTTSYAMTWSDLRDGFSFQLPADPDHRRTLVGLALMAFGITGVGASELIMYPYWCLEKGYGRYVGSRTDSEEWRRRALGWIRVMHYDAWLCMILFTVATLAFYLLGASLLHEEFLNTGATPKGAEMVQRLSRMYSETFGDYAKYIFLLGAFAVLYSTFFIATAANARMVADWLGVIGAYDRHDPEKRRVLIAVFSTAFPVFSTSMYIIIGEPVAMVAVSGVMQALMLPMIGIAVMYFAYWRTDKRVLGGRWWFATLWLSFFLMAMTSLYGAYKYMDQYRKAQPKARQAVASVAEEAAPAGRAHGRVVPDVAASAGRRSVTPSGTEYSLSSRSMFRP